MENYLAQATTPPIEYDATEVTCGTEDNPGIQSSIGCIPFNDTVTLASSAARISIGIAGGIALILIAIAAFRVMTSQGDPKSLQSAKDGLFSAISALIMIILAGFVLRLIGINVLGLF